MRQFITLVIVVVLTAIQIQAQVAINTDGNQPEPSAGLDVKFTNKGLLPPRMTQAQMNAIQNPASGLLLFCIDCGSNSSGSLALYVAGAWWTLSANCINPAAPTAGAHVPSGTQIIWNWNTVVGATGYKWNTTNDYGTAVDMGTSTTKTEPGLNPNTQYTRYVWAYNNCGISVSTALNSQTVFTCGGSFTVTHVAGDVAPVNKTTAYGTVTGVPGEPALCWITSNLGSDHQAAAVNDATEASAGWYWQFNRKQGFKHDGTTRTPNTTWIFSIDENINWVIANDPCSIELGGSWRIPTYTEWSNVDNSGGWTNWNSPWNSTLKLHAAGYLDASNGSLNGMSYTGYYGSSTQHNSQEGTFLFFYSESCNMNHTWKAYGFNLRCVK